MCILLLALFALPMSPLDSFDQLRSEWAQDLHEKRVADSVALYTPDAVFVQRDGSRVEGTTAIRDLYQKVTSTFDSTLSFSSERVDTCGNLAYDSGTYTETLITRATDKSMQMKGSYLTLYRKEKDTSWKIVEQDVDGGSG